LADGKKFFMILQNLLLAITVFFLIKNNIYGISLGITALIIMSAIDRKYPKKVSVKSAVIYIFFSFAFLVSFRNSYMFPTVASLIFLFGFPTGSILMKDKISIKKISIIGLPFLIISFLLSFL